MSGLTARHWARISGGKVVEIVLWPATITPAAVFGASLAWVDVTAATDTAGAAVALWCGCDGSHFTPPAPPAPPSFGG